MKEESSVKVEFGWEEDNRYYQHNFLSQTKELVTSPKLLIGQLALLQKNESPSKKDLAKISYIWKNLPPLYTKEELDLLEALIEKTAKVIQWWEEVDLFEVEEPTKLPVSKLSKHPLNKDIYGVDENVRELANQIKMSGWIKPITINLKGQSLGGNRRLDAIALLAEDGILYEEVEVKIERLSEDQELQRLILDNASRHKTNLQMLREAQYLKIFYQSVSCKRKANLSPSESSFLEYWEGRKESVKKQKKKKSVKVRDVLGSFMDISGDQARKGLKVLWLIDLLTDLGRTQEVDEIVKALNKDNITAAYKKCQEWEEDNPTQYRYVGNSYGDISNNDTVEMIHTMTDNDPAYCYVSNGSSPLRILRKDLVPLESVNKKKAVNKNGELSKPKKKAKPKFEVGDRIVYHNQKGVVIEVENGFYGLELDQGQIVRKASEEMFSRDDSWNPDDFGDINRQQENDGQGIIFQEETEEPPDPDDFEDKDSYESAYKQWCKTPESGNVCKQSLTIKDFQVGQFYSNGHSVARLLSKTRTTITLQWLGMGFSPAPMGSDYYPEEGIEAHAESEILKSLQPYPLDLFDPPPYVERKFQPDDLVCPKWKKETREGQGRVIGYSEGSVIYQEDSGEEHRLSEDKLCLLSKNGFSVGDRVTKLIPDFSWQPKTEGLILALYSVCCDVEFEGEESPCRLMYAWIDRANRQLEFETGVEFKPGDRVLYDGKKATFKRYLEGDRAYICLDESIPGRKNPQNKSVAVLLSEIQLDPDLIALQSCNSLSELNKLLDSDWLNSLNEADIKAIIRDLWVKLSEEKF